MIPFFDRFSRTLTIEVNPKYLRWGFLQPKGESKVISYGEIGLEGRSHADISSQLPTNVTRTILIIPRNELLTKVLHLPATQTKELAPLIQFKLPQEIPYALSEVVYHSELIRIQPGGYSEICVLWMLRKNIEEKITLLRELGLEVDKVFSSSQSILSYYLQVKERNAELPSQTCLLSLDKKTSELLAVSGERVLLSAPLRTPYQDEAQKESFLTEVKNAMASFEKEMGFTSTSLQLMFPGEELSSVKNSLSGLSSLSVKTVPSLSGSHTSSAKEVPISLLGAGLKDLLTADLLPLELRDERKKVQNLRFQNQIAVSLTVFMIITLAALGLNLASQKTQLRRVLKEFDTLSPEARKVVQIAEEMEMIRKIGETKDLPLSFLSSLSLTIPPQITLTRIEYDEKDGFKIQGWSDTNQSISQYVKTVKTFPEAVKVNFDHSRRKNEGGKDVFEFQFTVKSSKEERKS